MPPKCIMSPVIRKIKIKINYLMYMKMTTIKIATKRACHVKEVEKIYTYLILVNMKKVELKKLKIVFSYNLKNLILSSSLEIEVRISEIFSTSHVILQYYAL